MIRSCLHIAMATSSRLERLQKYRKVFEYCHCVEKNRLHSELSKIIWSLGLAQLTFTCSCHGESWKLFTFLYVLKCTSRV